MPLTEDQLELLENGDKVDLGYQEIFMGYARHRLEGLVKAIKDDYPELGADFQEALSALNKATRKAMELKETEQAKRLIKCDSCSTYLFTFSPEEFKVEGDQAFCLGCIEERGE